MPEILELSCPAAPGLPGARLSTSRATKPCHSLLRRWQESRALHNFYLKRNRRDSLLLITKRCCDATRCLKRTYGQHFACQGKDSCNAWEMWLQGGHCLKREHVSDVSLLFTSSLASSPPLSNVISAKDYIAHYAESMRCILPVPVLFTSILI